MIDELAKFICCPEGKCRALEPGDLDPCSVANYHKVARAVLTRLREPTPGMVSAGLVEQLEGGFCCDIWQAMIDAAMEGPKSENPPTP